MKEQNYLIALFLLFCLLYQAKAAPKPVLLVNKAKSELITSFEQPQKDSSHHVSKTLYIPKKKKKLGWAAKLQLRLLTGIIKRRIKKLEKKQLKNKQQVVHSNHLPNKNDSLFIRQIINTDNRQLALGLKNNFRTRTKLNIIREKFNNLAFANPDILTKKIAKEELKRQILEGSILEAEIAEYVGYGLVGVYDSISVEQIITLKNKQIAQFIGIKNNVRTRAKLNMIKEKLENMAFANPDILKKKIANEALKRQILEGGMLEAEIAQFTGYGLVGVYDSISVEQIITLKNKQIAKFIGIKNNVRTRAKLNMMRHKYKELSQNQPDILKNKVTKEELKQDILSGGMTAAELARYFGLASLIFLLLSIFLFSGIFLFLLYFLHLGFLTSIIIAMGKGQTSIAFGTALAIFYSIALIVAIILFIRFFDID